MYKVGMTGGIGSGKSTLCERFSSLGVSVYLSDERAKALMNTNDKLIMEIKNIFGDEAYTLGELNRALIAELVFKDKKKLAELNAVVHPAVLEDFNAWAEAQTSRYVILESAILVESGFYAHMDACVGVISDKELRIERVISRDNCTREQVLSRLAAQMPEEEMIKFCDYTISNNLGDELDEQVAYLDKIFSNEA
ncbi:MAG: dephospho-CoA kinase [Rikenellaceae bacterium]